MVEKGEKVSRPRTEKLEIPADAWEKCEACGHTDIREKFVRNLNVCPNCDYHRRIRAGDYVGILLKSFASSTTTTYCCNAALASFTTVAPVVCDDFYEPNNTSGQAKAISLGAIISGMISSSADVDWFKVTMPNNSNTTLQAALSNSPADYDLYVYNKNLSLVGSSANTGTSNEVVIYNARQRNAPCYIKVIGKNTAYAASECYNLLAQALGNAGSVTQSSSDFSNEITTIRIANCSIPIQHQSSFN